MYDVAKRNIPKQDNINNHNNKVKCIKENEYYDFTGASTTKSLDSSCKHFTKKLSPSLDKPTNERSNRDSYDRETWEAINTGNTSLFCCVKCNIYLEAKASQQVRCYRCNQIIHTIESNSLDSMDRAKAFSLDQYIASILQRREFRAKEISEKMNRISLHMATVLQAREFRAQKIREKKNRSNFHTNSYQKQTNTMLQDLTNIYPIH